MLMKDKIIMFMFQIVSNSEVQIKAHVVPTTAGEQKVIDTWDLTSLDRAWRLLFKLNI